MKKCLKCGKKLDNARAKFCSDKCRMAYKRANKQPEQPEQPEQMTRTSNPNKQPEQGSQRPSQYLGFDNNDVREMNAEELYEGIRMYEEDTWKDGPEYKELDRRLRAYSIKRLEKEGYIVPNWVKLKARSKKKSPSRK